MSDTKKSNLLWWVVPRVLAGMPMPFIHPERRLNSGGPVTAYDDELPQLYSAGVRAVVSLLNIPTDAAVYESAGFAFLCLPIPDGAAPTMEQALDFVRFVNAQRKIQRPQPEITIVLFDAGLQCKSRHHRHNVQKQNDVRRPQIGNIASLYFEISPKKLVRPPRRQTEAH